MLTNKKAISLVVSYVLLISIGLSIAGLVYGWLRFYVNVDETKGCPDGIFVTFSEVDYNKNDSVPKNAINMTLKIQNRGTFNVDGYIIRANNKTNSSTGIWTLHLENNGLNVSQTQELFLDNENLSSFGKICYLTLQPFIMEKGNVLPCTRVASREVEC